MDSTITAAAHAEAEFRMTDEEIVEQVSTGLASPMLARDLLLALNAVTSETEYVKQLRNEVAERYDLKLRQLADRAAFLRDQLDQYVRANGGKVSTPDAGTAYLTTKNKGGKLTVEDEDALLEFLKRRLPHVVQAATVSSIDFKSAFTGAVDELNIAATRDGDVVDVATGEVVELPGISAEPESKTLAVRAA